MAGVRLMAIVCFTFLSLAQYAAARDVIAALDDARRLSRAGKYAEAVAVLEREVLPESAGATPEARIAAFELLGITREMTGEDEEAAEAYLLRWLELVATHGSDDLTSIREAARVATVLTRAGAYEQSRAFWRLHLATADRAGLGHYINRADAYAGIARSYDREGIADNAEVWYRRSLDEVPTDSLQRAVILVSYAGLLEKLQRGDEAQALRKEADTIRASEAR